MRIGIFTDYYYPHVDGVAISVETFRKGLEQLGHEVWIIAPSPSLRYKEKDPHVIRFPAIKIESLNSTYVSFFFPPQTTHEIEDLKLDIVHSQSPLPIGILGVSFALKNHLPLVSTYHTDAIQYAKHYRAIFPLTVLATLFAPVMLRGGRQEIRQAMEALRPKWHFDEWNEQIVTDALIMFYNTSDQVIVPSGKIKKQLDSWKIKPPIDILPTGVAEITTTKAKTQAFRKEHGFTQAEKLVLLVSRLGAEKNVDLLVRSFPAVLAAERHARLVLVGDHPRRKEMVELTQELGIADQTVFTGTVSHKELGAIYAAADLFAFPSLADTQGLVVNEAAAAGLPIVMVDREISQVVKKNQSGLYAKNNPADFAAKIITLLQDDGQRQRYGEHARQLAAELIPVRQAEKLLGLYEETITRYGHKAHPAKHRWLPF